MRQGFLIGAIVLWVAINILGSIAEMQPFLSQTDPNVTNDSGVPLTQQGTLDEIGKPSIVTDSGFVSTVVTSVTAIGKFLVTLGKIFTLWHPALWQGTALYLYYFLILPIGASFWVVVIMDLRGVGSR